MQHILLPQTHFFEAFKMLKSLSSSAIAGRQQLPALAVPGRGRQDGPTRRRLPAETEQLRCEAEFAAAAVLDSQRGRPHNNGAAVKLWRKR